VDHAGDGAPFKNIDDVKRMVNKDIERIYECVDKKKVCEQAQFPYRLFGGEYEYLSEVKENFKRVVGKMEGTVMIVPESCTLYYVLERYGIDWWSFLYHDYPELSIKYLDALTEYELARIDNFADISISPISFTSDPIGVNDNLLFSPNFTLDVLLPKTKKLIERWKSYGYYYIYFADGFKRPILDEILSWGLIDAVDPFKSLAHMDVKKFRGRYPNVTICQPIDCQKLLHSGTPNEIRKATTRAIKEAEAKKIFIGSTSEVHPSVPIKNAMMMYETTKNFMA